MRYLSGLAIIWMWLGGIVLATGFWQTTFAIFPLYGMYLFVEHVFKLLNFI
jgi:hypothetical protein